MSNVARTKIIGALALAALVAACSSGSGGGGSGGTTSGPLKIGVLVNNSGILTNANPFFEQGYATAAAYASQHYLNGRKIQLVKVEDDGTPTGTVTAVKQLIQQDGVKLIAGATVSEQSLAISPVVTRLGGIYIDSLASDDELTQAQCQDGYFRTQLQVSQYGYLIGDYAKSTGVKQWIYIGSDSDVGHSLETSTVAALSKIGGTVTKSLFVPEGTSDFGPYITQLAGSPDTGLISALSGGDAITFTKQAAQYKLFAKYKAIAGYGLVSDLTGPDLQTYGPQLAKSVEVSVPYSAGLKSAANEAFLKEFAQVTKLPAVQAGQPGVLYGYNQISIYAQAVERAKSDDPVTLRKVLSGGTFSTPAGSLTFRAADHQGQAPGLITAGVKVNGTWTIEPVTQYAAAQISVPVSGCHLSNS